MTQDLRRAVADQRGRAKIVQVGATNILMPPNLSDDDARRAGFADWNDLRQRIDTAKNPDEVVLGPRDTDRGPSPRLHRYDCALPTLDLATEWVADYKRWDESGYLWGRDGHWPLFAAIGAKKHYSTGYHEKQKTRNHKAKVWKDACASGHGYAPWPWWIEYSGEPGYWREGRDGGGEWSGKLWLAARSQWSAEEVAAYEAPWVRAYGDEAAQRCLTYCEMRQATAETEQPPAPAGGSGPSSSQMREAMAEEEQPPAPAGGSAPSSSQ